MIRLFTLFLALMTVGSLNAQYDYIWGGEDDPNSTFEGGLNDWTTSGSDPDGIAVFVHELDGMADRGAFWGTQTAIESPTVANGAMVFDSDFYDNDGDSGNQGGGAVPAPHNGYLTSPSFDCSGEDGVAVKFNQFARNFQSAFFVEVSIDGGTEWTQFQVNTDLATNTRTLPTAVNIVDISSVAANESDVTIRFNFAANYYYWIIDDVSVIQLPDFGVRLVQTFSPVSGLVIPEHSLSAYDMNFAMVFQNYIGNEPTDGTVTASVLSGTDVIWSESEDFTNLENNGTLDTFIFNASIDESEMEGVFTATGDYTLNYLIETETPDFFTGDNTRSIAFTVTDNIYNATTARSGWAYGDGGNWQAANVYRTGDLPDNFTLVATSTDAGYSTQNPTDELDVEITVNLYEMDEDITPDLANLDVSAGAFDLMEQLTAIGFGGDLFESEPQRLPAEPLFNFELLDANTGSPGAVPMKANRLYLVENKVFATNEEFPVVFVYGSNAIAYLATNNPSLVGTGSAIGIGDVKWNLPLNTEIISSVGEIPTFEHNAIDVYPNPANNVVNVDINLKNVEEKVTVSVTNITGQVQSYNTYYNVTSTTQQIDIANLQSGTYFVNLLTNNGVQTEKLTVVK